MLEESEATGSSADPPIKECFEEKEEYVKTPRFYHEKVHDNGTITMEKTT